MLNHIIFYDGDCGLCQRSIAYLAQNDVKKKLLFAPLNGETYRQVFQNEPADLKTVMFYTDSKTKIKSDAILSALYFIGGYNKLFIIAKIIPSFIRDRVYDFIANHRKKITCIILTRDERFLK